MTFPLQYTHPAHKIPRVHAGVAGVRSPEGNSSRSKVRNVYLLKSDTGPFDVDLHKPAAGGIKQRNTRNYFLFTCIY